MDGIPNCWWNLPLVILLLAASSPQTSAQPPSAELAVILSKWKAAVSDLKQFEIQGTRIIYKDVFEEEVWGKIRIRYEGPQQIRFDILPVEILSGEVSRRQGSTGKPFQLSSNEPAMWLWADHEIVYAIPGSGRLISGTEQMENSILRVESSSVPPPPALPEDPPSTWQWFSRVFSWKLGPIILPEMLLPALFGPRSDSFVDDHEWTITKSTTERIQLVGKPKSRKRQDCCDELSVLLDAQTGRPVAQRIIGPSGHVSSVITFQQWKLQPTDPIFRFRRSEWDFERVMLPREMPVVPVLNRK